MTELLHLTYSKIHGGKKLSFNGIITGTSFSSTVGDISTVSVSFQYAQLVLSLLTLLMPKVILFSKQRKLAAVAPPRDKITAADLKKLRSRKKEKEVKLTTRQKNLLDKH